MEVCTVCHTPNYVYNFYEQYDGVIELYNSKFADPGIKFMALLYENNLISPAKFNDPVEWTWWEIWHHEGRVARHGASMMAPDYTHWHGLYEVAKHWYTKFIPELEEIVEVNMASGDAEKIKGAELLSQEIEALLARPEHAWYTGRLSEEEREMRRKAQEEFKKRYGTRV